MEIYSGYGPKTLVSGWNYDESYPKDYDTFGTFPAILSRSTHNRLGTWTENEMKTVSVESQKAALSEPRGASSKRALVNILTFSATLGEHRKKYWKQIGIKLPPENADSTDYTSTYHTDFINFFPERPKIVPRDKLMKPETKFRRLLVDGADPRRPGVNTFYDDNMDYLRVKSKERTPPPYELHYDPQRR